MENIQNISLNFLKKLVENQDLIMWYGITLSRSLAEKKVITKTVYK